MSQPDCQPIVTYAGDRAVFSNIEPGLVSGLPTESVEWKRSYGRNSRQVYVDVGFQPFNAELVLNSDSLQGQPVFHTFWTDVVDIDVYRQGVKEDILAWLNTLKKSGITSDWMIVVVETPEHRKGNKLSLRATVLDKLKQEIGGKTPDRCVALMDPTKADSRAAESMQTLLHKFRQFFLQSYNKVLNKFEENIRSQREKRTDLSWNFCEYFLLQEQLAFVYENMGLYDEGLIQYDELDALFTQFVLNSNVGEIPSWLEQFNKDLTDWTVLSLDKNTNMKLRLKLTNNNPSLLDMRNYLFSRQCSLLLLSNKPQEVAGRTLSFLHNTIQELNILEVEEMIEGSLDSWMLLVCLEVVQTCDSHHETNSSSGGHAVLPTHTASLWSAAREKLLRLGHLCGLMPNQAPTSEQLHRVISITGGLQETDISVKEDRSPVERLKESLSSNAAFQRNYLEMCEIAISSYKHIGRIRSARLVGKDLAMFYIQLGEVQKAATFLVEALKTFQMERWDKLSLQTMLDLTKCYKTMGDKEKYVRMCTQIASNKVASSSDREYYFGEITKTLNVLGQDTIALYADDIVDFVSCQVDKTSHELQIIPGSRLSFSLVLRSNLPKALPCSSLKISLSLIEEESTETVTSKKSHTQVGHTKSVQRSPSAVSNSQVEVQVEPDTCEVDEYGKLDMVEQLDYKQDKSLCAARLVCKNSDKVLKRKDSSGSILKDASQLQKGDFTLCLEESNLVLEPGVHTYKVATVASKEGKYMMTQMSAQIHQLDLIHNIGTQSFFTVTSSPPVITLNRVSKELYAGLENSMVLNVFTGSKTVQAGTEVCLTSSRGLVIKVDQSGAEFSSKLSVFLPAGEPFQTITSKIIVKADLSNQKDSGSIEHKVTLTDPWANTDIDVFVHFIPAFYTTFHLLTAMEKKFLQIFLYPLTETSFSLSKHKMVFNDGNSNQELTLAPINREDDVLVVNNTCEGGFLWQLNFPPNMDTDQVDGAVRVCFSLQYKEMKAVPQEEEQHYEASFQFQNFMTLYTIQAKVEPAKGNEFCRAGTMCPMTVQLEQCNVSPHTSLFYEVIADQAVWAVCGRQGAVVNIAQSTKQNIVVEVMPLVGGHLALPSVRLSKYIPADSKSGAGLGAARLDPFATGQVYNMSRSQQVHVLPPLNHHVEFVSLP